MVLKSSGLAYAIEVIPRHRGVQRLMVRPKTWKKGNTASRLSMLRTSIMSEKELMLDSRFCCVSCTTFGSFSLPLVNKITAGDFRSLLPQSFLIRPIGSLDLTSASAFSKPPRLARISSMKTISGNSAQSTRSSSALAVIIVLKSHLPCA